MSQRSGPVRCCLVVSLALVCGPLWYYSLWILPWTRELAQKPHLYGIPVDQFGMIIAFAFTALVVLCPRRLPRGPKRGLLFLEAARSIGIGASLFMWICYAVGLAQAVSTGRGALYLSRLFADNIFVDLASLIILAPVFGFLVAVLATPVVLPIACGIVWARRRLSAHREDNR